MGSVFMGVVFGAADAWVGAPRGAAYAITSFLLRDQYAVEGPGPDTRTKVYEEGERALESFFRQVVSMTYGASKQNNIAYKQKPPLRVFSRGTERLVLAHSAQTDTGGMLLRGTADGCSLESYERDFDAAADAAVLALKNDGWTEELTATPHAPWKKPMRKGVVTYPGFDGRSLDVAYGSGKLPVARAQLVDANGGLVGRMRVIELFDHEDLSFEPPQMFMITEVADRLFGMCMNRNIGGGLTCHTLEDWLFNRERAATWMKKHLVADETPLPLERPRPAAEKKMKTKSKK
jgi:hypothetical protein